MDAAHDWLIATGLWLSGILIVGVVLEFYYTRERRGHAPYTRSASDIRAIWIVVALSAILVAVFYHQKKTDVGGIFLFLFALIIYIPLTYIAFRTAVLHGALRYFFCLTAAPLFIVVFAVCMIEIFRVFPWLAESLSRALAAGGRNAGMAQGIPSVILAAAVFWAWYKILKVIDGIIYRTKANV